MVVGEVPGDRVRSGVQALGREVLRSSTINSTVVAAMAVGDVFGRREGSSNATSPSARQRATSSYTHERATP